SPDSRRFAYAMPAPNAPAIVRPWDDPILVMQQALTPKQVCVIDGVAGLPYDQVGSIMFSPDSRRTLYVTEGAEGQTAVVDGLPQETYRGIRPGSLSFSAD